MAAQLNNSNERLITACLFAFSDCNGILEVTIRDSANGRFVLTRTNHYFRAVENMKQYKVKINSEEFDEPTIFHVLYDKTLHGMPICPYMVFKAMAEGHALDLQREDYMAVMKAVEQFAKSE
ncbi:uncharacterized protein HD556DRAFT_1308500 [Suillus plorans]|uniref:Uncharacterized protein n=1 Tax=Suillus plorans TaxID=116603 RepID=A0A9P7ARL7_9AGAM|nr:uncharacterized protein HD556DRAFT_1308500 [Suillus plorans]KAG1793647.1 hypothetical protein HD556DRAFT_1308500 [Suillus plorans]